MEAAQVSLLRWLRRQLRQPIPLREHLEAAVDAFDSLPPETKASIERFAVALEHIDTDPSLNGRLLRELRVQFAELKAALAGAGVEPKAAPMRARQLWNWAYVHGARDFAAMSNLAKGFRAEMETRFTLARPEIVTDILRWRVRPDAPELEIPLEDVFQDV